MNTRTSYLLKIMVASNLMALAIRADTPALQIDITGRSFGQSQNTQSIGWDFTVNTPMTVTQLGVFDTGHDGLSQSHRVGIWTEGGVLLGEGTVAAGISANLVGDFRYVNVLGIALTPGNYVIGAHYENQSPDTLPEAANSIWVDPALTFTGPRYGLGAGLVFPNIDQAPAFNHFGPNFQFTSSVPDATNSLNLFSVVGLALLVGKATLRNR